MDATEAASFENRYFSKANVTLVIFRSGPGAGLGPAMGSEANGVRFELDDDLSPLFHVIIEPC
jgi:hypothetical protein